MEVLGAAAAAADAAPVPVALAADDVTEGGIEDAGSDVAGAPEAAQAPKGAKRLRGAAKIEKDLDDLRKRMRTKVGQIVSAEGRPIRRQADRDNISKWKEQLSLMEQSAAIKEQELLAAKQAEDLKKKAAATKAEEALTKAQNESYMSEAGAIELVNLVFKFMWRLTNTSDKVESVWAHIHSSFMKLIQDGILPASDGRSVAALRSR